MSRIRVPRISIEYGITQDQPTSTRPVGIFVVSLWGNKQNYYVGSFANLEVARIARNKKMRELGLKAKPTVAGVEHLPDDLKLVVESKEAVAKKSAIRADKASLYIESRSQKFDRQQKAKKEATVIDFMRSDTVSSTYPPSLYRDNGKDYTPVYRHRSMT